MEAVQALRYRNLYKNALYLTVIQIQRLSNVTLIKTKAPTVDSSKVEVELSEYLNAIGEII